MDLPTVEINRGGHRLIINQADFDPQNDTLWSTPDESQKESIEQTQAQNELRDDEGSNPEEGEISQVPIEARLEELRQLATDWRKIKPVAEAVGITERPTDGWDAAVLPILIAEYGQNAAEEIYTSAEE